MKCFLKTAHMNYNAVQQVILQLIVKISMATRWCFIPQSCFSTNVSSTQ